MKDKQISELFNTLHLLKQNKDRKNITCVAWLIFDNINEWLWDILYCVYWYEHEIFPWLTSHIVKCMSLALFILTPEYTKRHFKLQTYHYMKCMFGLSEKYLQIRIKSCEEKLEELWKDIMMFSLKS